MKRINIKILLGTVMMALLMMACSGLLKEQPRSIYTPQFFKTQNGVTGGITALYANLRNIYGNAFYNNTGETGTDEYTYGQSASDQFKVMDVSGQGDINSTNSRSDVLWGAAFPAINTASGIIENGSQAGVDSSLVAEARFFRAFYYFQLVQTFGGVPLDLGSGELKFNTNPIRVSKRNTVPEVYTKAIFPDLQRAVSALPADPRVTGAVTQDVARLYLAKAYLTYAWWLQNPNNIPTYPAVSSRKDPDGKTAQQYFQMAYDVATTAINNPGPYGLMPTFYDLHNGKNDRNKEEMLYADHTQSDEYYNGSSLTYSNVGDGSNTNVWMMTWNYTTLTSSTSPTNWNSVNSVQREASQALGRPWIRMAPTIGSIENTFSDKTNDSRYDGTFTTSYRGNWNLSGTGISQDTLYNANNLPIAAGDPVLSFLNQTPSTPITYPSGQGNSNIGAGTLPGRSDFVIGPNGISRIVYPGLWKLGEYRTDNNGGLGQPNAGSTRPVVIAYFSQLYFIAAEAAVKGATAQAGMTARDLINVIRARAGKWDYDNNGDSTKVADNSAAMVAATPATITVDYILEERSREYYGEGKRWLDLVRTQEWGKLAGSYEIAGSNYGDHKPETITRDIKPYLYLRPIPQGQIDALQMSDAEKQAYQNPGYN
ncbi:MAG TPA: RagB/SusD family nutrient uptake outer membrane protein [Balneolales bacterium]|nr:RagB/SusD family nutrient uptake outer membrane protein [Balneolales bacterium]